MEPAALAGDGFHRAVARAHRTAGAVRLDLVADQGAADLGRALLLVNVRFVFGAEMLQRAHHRVRRALSQTAQRRGVNLLAQQFQPFDVAVLAFAVADALQDFQHALGAHAAGRALAAGLVLGEFHEEAGDVHHAGLVVHDDQTAGTHHRARRRQRFVIDRAVEILRGQTAAHRAADLHGLEALAILDAAAHVVDDFAQGDAQRHFDQAGVLHIAGDGKGLGAFALLGAHAGEPVRALAG